MSKYSNLELCFPILDTLKKKNNIKPLTVQKETENRDDIHSNSYNDVSDHKMGFSELPIYIFVVFEHKEFSCTLVIGC